MTLDYLIKELRDVLPDRGHFAFHAVWTDSTSDFALVSTPVLDVEVDGADQDINLIADTMGTAVTPAVTVFSVVDMLHRLEPLETTMAGRPVFAATLRFCLSGKVDSRIDTPLVGVCVDDALARFGVVLWSDELDRRLRDETV